MSAEQAPQLPPDLVRLAGDHPDLEFGSDYVTRASAGDMRYVWARPRDGRGPLTYAWTAPELAILLGRAS